MFIDVAADIFGRKDNIRLEFPPTVSSMSLAELFHRVDAAYARVIEQLLGRQRKPTTSRDIFASEEVRLLVLDRSNGKDVARWVVITDCSQLTPYCQLYVFQSRDRTREHGGDAQAPLPEARVMRVPHTLLRQRTPPTRNATPRRRTTSAPRTAPSPLTTSPPQVSVTASDDVVLHFLQSNGSSSPSGQRVCSAVLLSRLLNAVGVNLNSWNDPAFAFLASAGLTAARPQILVSEYRSFCRAYPSLVKLMHRHLLERYGNGLTSLSPRAGSADRRDWSPPRTPTTSQPREESPRRRTAPSPHRQNSVSSRLSSGLSSIPTAKDRKLRIYDP
ncbi:Hypothetical protein, putative [Bodo saltans]|uniref:Uncharacterized protein n=1 Tax=Bodo saltans TaxID=75058 RepID=A0A0S4KLL5_BODSA|nr:Hypothetical protein, putative [Bodo saltans]|eukprot:CUI15518.1 Hypothetical protein, putative [Bodo saltans]